MKKTTKLRLFGGLVILFNLWLIGRYNLEGLPVLLLTLGFAIGYEFLVVRSIKNNDNLEAVITPLPAGTSAEAASPHSVAVQEPLPPVMTPDEEMEHLAVTRDGDRYRYQSHLYDRLDDALKYARLDRSRVYKCK